MSGKPLVVIVGAGNFAAALAVGLSGAGYAIEAVVSRSGAASLNKARRLAGEVGARVWRGVSQAKRAEVMRADIVWFCVPDSEIARAARTLSGGVAGKLVEKIEWKGRVALHSSGALASDGLGVLRERGAALASVHPLMTFVRGSRPPLAGMPFAIEGDAAAVRVARRVVKDLGGRACSIRKEDKVKYHAWGTFASPLFTALLATTEQVAVAAGVSCKTARRRMIPILQQTLANYAAFGAADGFSGPIVRGDADTVRRHLRVLRRVPPAREVYIALARAALRYLPAKKKNMLKKVLDSQLG